MSSPRAHYVYQYRYRSDGPVRTAYVGYGEDPARAISHARTSHNTGLAEWLESNKFDLRIAGPYPTKEEALHVEAALISAMEPTFNKDPGTGPKFRPLGVLADLADRPAEPPLTLSEIGKLTGGALVVYITSGAVMPDGRPKYDPADPDPETVVIDVEGWWQIDRYVSAWAADPASGPQVLVGVYGRINHRFVIGAYEIATDRWGDNPDENKKAGRLWRVPLTDRANSDASALCGRRIEGLKFGQSRSDHYRIVDGRGRVLGDTATESHEVEPVQ